jgi:hypothetical protein
MTGNYSNAALANPQSVQLTLSGTVTGLASLLGRISNKSGPQNARVWTVSVGNTGTADAVGVQINGITLTQTFGTACTPVVQTSFPIAIGTISPGNSASGGITIDFAGCANNVRFTVKIPFSANNGTLLGSLVVYNQFQ